MKNPMPKKQPGTSTPINNNQQVIRRHAAVLGLGALVTAFPYTTPPPEWMPEILALLASRAAHDAGSIGKTVKTILADFKKTRQDTWVTDQKVCLPSSLRTIYLLIKTVFHTRTTRGLGRRVMEILFCVIGRSFTHGKV
jgi:proteasome activator subunit 4